MFRIIVNIIVISVFGFTVSAQDDADFRQVDIRTYQYYMAEQWDSLIRLGEPAIKNGVDYYYLRMRLGIARYENRNYIKSIRHFRQALEFNSGDPVALEYLYYAYLLSGKSRQAQLLTGRFSEKLKNKTGIKPKPVEKIDVNIFYSKSGSDDIVQNSSEYFPTDLIGYQVVTKYYSNFNCFFEHYLGSRFSLQHSYTFLNKENFNYLNNGINIIKNPGISVKQHQYYIAFNTAFAGGWNLTPFTHIVRTSYPLLTSITQGGPGRPPSTQYTGQDETSLLAGLMLTKSVGPVDLRLYGHGSGLNKKKQAQGAGGFTWFPFGNLDLYIGSDLVVLSHLNDSARETKPVVNGMIGLSLAGKIWFEFSLAAGEMHNYAERNGYLVFNSTDYLEQKYDVNISVPVTEKGSLIYAGARFSVHASYLTSIIEPELTKLNKLTYNSLSFYGGVSWKF